MTKDEAIALLEGQFGTEVLTAITNYVAPLYLMQPQNKGYTVVKNGTTFFLQTPQKTIGVTADHVFQDFIDAQASNNNLICAIYDLIIDDLENRLIDRSKGLDIATFRISPQEVRNIKKYCISYWPPVIPEIGKGIMFTGFPGEDRKQLASRKIEFGTYSALGTATSVRDTTITCQFNRRNWTEIRPFALPEENFDLGGLSGAPMLTVLDKGGVMAMALGGVIFEFSQEFEIVMASRADVILPDGMLKKN